MVRQECTEVSLKEEMVRQERAESSLLEEITRWERMESTTPETTQAHWVTMEAVNEANTARVAARGDAWDLRIATATT